MAQLDILWVLLATFLVVIMQPGFMCLEAGLAQSKNNINISLKNALDFAISFIIFWTIGFDLMFGESLLIGWIGTPNFLSERKWTPEEITFYLFQSAFCATSATIVSGAVAERMRLKAYFIIPIFISLIIYPIYGHWAWAGDGEQQGWLKAIGFIDFAGSSVVHSVGGWVALAVLLHIGPRLGFSKEGKNLFIPSSLPLFTLGVFLLMIGWFGFNAGSTLTFDGTVPLILLNTFLGAVGGMLAVTAFYLFSRKHLNVVNALTGVISGLVGVTAACHMLEPKMALLTGIIAAHLGLWATKILKERGVDDMVGAFPAHTVAGAFGTLAVGLFGDSQFFGEGLDRGKQIGVQILGISSCGLWSFGVTYLAFFPIKAIVRLRVNASDEAKGLNVSEHKAYTQGQLLLDEMNRHQETGDLSSKVQEDRFTEVGLIAGQYNRVIDTVHRERMSQNRLLMELEHKSKENEQIVTSSSEAIIAMDREHSIFKWNPEASRLFGWKEQEVRGRDFFQLLMPEFFRTETGSSFIRRMDEKDPSLLEHRHELHLTNKDGLSFMAELMVQPMKDVDESYYCAFIRDLTEQKKYEDNLKHMRDTALSVAKAKSQFLATMSHEIRTPLNSILGFTQLLRDTSSINERKEFLDTIDRSGQNLLKIINDILDFSKVDANQMDLRISSFDLRDLIKEVIQSFSYKTNQNLEMGSYISDQICDLVHGDITLLRQVLTNLVNNAVKFTKEGTVMVKALLIDSSDHQQTVRIEVTDTGIGIPLHKQSKLFQSFTQVDNSSTRQYGGTGLGLAYCKKIVELMGGNIGFTSEEGKGSTFWMSLTVQTSDLVERRELGPLKGRTVFFADDNKEIRFLLRNYLEDWRIPHHGCETTYELIEVMKEMKLDSPPLILMDAHLLRNPIHWKDFEVSCEPIDAKVVLMIQEYQESSILGERGWGELKKPFSQESLFEKLISMVDLESETTDGSSIPQLIGSDEELNTQASEPDPESPTRRILIVEDNTDNQALISRFMTRWGLTFDMAEDGAHCMKMLESQNYDLVLLDLQMPVMDGYEAIHRIRNHEKEHIRNLAVYALTASTSAEEEGKCKELGFDKMISKPIEFKRFKGLLQDFLN